MSYQAFRPSYLIGICLLIFVLLLSACGGGASPVAEQSSESGAAVDDSASAPSPSTLPMENNRAAADDTTGAQPPAPEGGGEAPALEPTVLATAETAQTEEEAAEEPAEEALADEEVAEEFFEGDTADTAGDAAAAPAPPTTSEPAVEQAGPIEDIEPVQPIEPAAIEINPLTATADDRLSTFALDVDTASYAATRNYIQNGALPPASTVRIEEFVNYFDYGYPNAEDELFRIAVDAAPTPSTSDTAANTQIVRVGIQGKQIDDSERDDMMLTFVIDISGSMGDYNRLPLVKESLGLLVENLRPTDEIAIVVYSDNTRAILEHTPVAERDTILAAINQLQTEGSTNVEAGLTLGYQLAADNFRRDAVNRVLLLSDGVANVGATGPDEMLRQVRDYAAQGVVLTTVGFGMNDFNDQLMEQLANDGNGNYAYIDTIAEAQRLFADNLTSTLQFIARDAKIQVDFNPEVVSHYRLLGYENRAVADADFRNDTVDAGEVGAGHSVTALYEVQLTEQNAGVALIVQLRYEDIETGEVIELQQPLDTSTFHPTFEAAPVNLQLAVAVAGFADQLRGGGYMSDQNLDNVLVLAEAVAPQFANNTDVQEFVELVQQAQRIQ